MKSAKILVGLVICVAVLAGAIITSWRAIAGSIGSTQPLSRMSVAWAPVAALPAGPILDPKAWQQASDQLAAQWQQADQAKAGKQYAHAAQKYLALADQLPESWQAMKALMKAASCKTEADPNVDVIGLYDQVIAIGKKYTTIDHGNVKKFGWDQAYFQDELKKQMLPCVCVAMCNKVVACYAAGNLIEAKRTLEGIRATFWDHSLRHHRRAYALEAMLTGEDVGSITDREDKAGKLFAKAHAAFVSHDYDTAGNLIESILTDYPQSAAVLPAMATKAKMIWNSAGLDDTTLAAYSEVLDYVKDTAPDCEFARIARSRIAFVESRRLFRNLENRQGVSHEEWEHLRNLCHESDIGNTELVEVVQSDTFIARSYYLAGEYEQALQVAAEAFRDHYVTDEEFTQHGTRRRSKELWRLKKEFANLQCCAARTLLSMGRCEDAYERLAWIVQIANPQPNNHEDMVIKYGYYSIWEVLRSCGGYEDVTADAAHQLLSRYPDSKAARALRKQLGKS